MTMNLLTILLALFIIISLAGDIIITRKLNKHEEEYSDKYNSLVEENTKLKEEIEKLSNKIKEQETNYTSICRSIDSLVQSDIELSDKITKLSEPEQVTKETVKQVLEEMDVLTGSVVNGVLTVEEK